MATKRVDHDTEFRQGVLLVVGLIIGAMVLGAVMHMFWQNHAAEEQAKRHETQYMTLGEQAATVGDNTVLVKFTVEYVGGDTEASLKQALPMLRRQVAKLISQVDKTDVQKLYTPQGKREMADTIRNLVQESLESKKDARNVKGVLFEKFLIRS